MTDVAYQGREQTAAKHFILRRYLQVLAFKILQSPFDTLTYIDGFSGPWESKTDDFSDTSFMIAIGVLKDAQRRVKETSGKMKRVNCIFVEKDRAAYEELRAAVGAHHDPDNHFNVYTFHGHFEDLVDEIMRVAGRSFTLTFIDPTGWTGFNFSKISPILLHTPGEVLINYMKSFVDRFTAQDVHPTADFDGILGKGWQEQIDPRLPRDSAVQDRFNDQFANAGAFVHVVSTPIEKVEDRTAFCIVYGTRKSHGLAAYREVEYSALKDHSVRRLEAKQAVHDAKTGMKDMFVEAGILPPPPIEQQLPDLREQASAWLVSQLHESGPRRFGDLWPQMLTKFTIRVTDAKTVCKELAKQGTIRATWRERNSRSITPNDDDLIELAQSTTAQGSK